MMPVPIEAFWLAIGLYILGGFIGWFIGWLICRS
jgi:hypothetical protein